jgi:hypothetical protein
MTTALLVFELNLADWVLVILSTAIIFAILGRRLQADIASWRQGRASVQKIDGSSAEP